MITFLSIFLVFLGTNLLLINSNGENIYPLYYGILSLPYIVSYFWVIFVSKQQFSLNRIITFFFLLKLYIVYMVIQYDVLATYWLEIGETGDIHRFHIPEGLSVKNLGNIFHYLFSSEVAWSGKLTHVIIFLNARFLHFLGFSFPQLGYYEVGLITYIFNVFINIFTIWLVYLAALQYSKSILFAQRAAFFIAFNPFFIYAAATAKKEAILMFALSIFLLYITQPIKKHYLFLIALLIVAFDRVYMVPFLILIYGIISGNMKTLFILGGVGLIGIHFLFGLEKIFTLYTNYMNAVNLSNSAISENNIFYNLLRALFSPSVTKLFSLDYFSGDLYLFLYYSLSLFFSVVAIRSLFIVKGLESIVFYTYLYVFILLPYASTFKLMVLSVFAVIFLDRISFVKFNRK